jgi:hypothetical protein
MFQERKARFEAALRMRVHSGPAVHDCETVQTPRMTARELEANRTPQGMANEMTGCYAKPIQQRRGFVRHMRDAVAFWEA